MIAKQRFNINSLKGTLFIFLVDTGIIKAAPNQPAERMANCEAFEKGDCKLLKEIGTKDTSCIAARGYESSLCVINQVVKGTLSKEDLLSYFAEVARMVTQKRR